MGIWSSVLQFIQGQDFTQDTPGYVNNPSLADKAHCIAFVIDAKKTGLMREEMWVKLRSFREALISRSKSVLFVVHVSVVISILGDPSN